MRQQAKQQPVVQVTSSIPDLGPLAPGWQEIEMIPPPGL